MKNIPSGCFDTPLPGHPNVYIASNDSGQADWSTADRNCKAWGGRLPTQDELFSLYRTKNGYGYFESSNYWSSKVLVRPDGEYYSTIDFADGWTQYRYTTSFTRCVKQV